MSRFLFILVAFRLGAPAFANTCVEQLTFVPIHDIYQGLNKTEIHVEFQRAIEAFWERERIYAYDPSVPRERTFVVDSPPPTLSGDLHVGHLVSYMQADTFIRFKRMNGMNVYFPIGWDSNGEPTYERIVQQFGIYPYGGQRNFEAFAARAHEFIAEDRRKNTQIMKDAGLSADWSLSYDTLDWNSQFTSQRAFLNLLNKNEIYFHRADTEQESQWKMRLKIHAPLLQDMVEQLEFLPVATCGINGEPSCYNYKSKDIIPWFNGLDRDWTISRLTAFGVPVPVWYPLDKNKQPQFDKPILATTEQLPVDSRTTAPIGFSEAQRDQAWGFTHEERYLSTWATSALTSLIQARWGQDPSQQRNVYPADFRWQGHDIIQTWLSFSLLSSMLNTGENPFSTIYINGMIQNQTGEKMSKGLGNGLSAEKALARYPSDYIRQLALDRNTGKRATSFNFEAGQKSNQFNSLAVLYFANQVAKFEKDFVLKGLWPPEQAEPPPLVRLQAMAMRQLARQTGKDYQEMTFANLRNQFSKAHSIISCFIHGQSLIRIDIDPSALQDFKLLLKDYLKILAPAYPFTTEVAWQEVFAGREGEPKSIHQTNWPVSMDEEGDPDALKLFLFFTKIISGDIRNVKVFPDKYLIEIAAPAEDIAFLKKHERTFDLKNPLSTLAKSPAQEIVYRTITNSRELGKIRQRVNRLGAGYSLQAQVIEVK